MNAYYEIFWIISHDQFEQATKVMYHTYVRLLHRIKSYFNPLNYCTSFAPSDYI